MHNDPPHYPRGIIFDFDDTVVATRSNRVNLLCEVALQYFDIRVSKEKLIANWGKPFDELIRNSFPDIDEKAFFKRYAEEMQKHPPKILPGVKKFFRQTRKNGIEIFILSSGSAKLVSQDLSEAHLLNYVCKLWGYEDTRKHKPDPDVLDSILEFSKGLGIPKTSLLYIGDSILDYAVAKRHEILFIATLTGENNRRDFVRAGLSPNHIVKNFTSINLKRSGLFIRERKVPSL